MFRLRLSPISARLEGVPSGSGALASASVAPVNARTLWVARSSPGCPTFPLPHPGGFVLHDQRVVAGLILIGAGDGHRLFAEFGGFEHTRLAQGHLAELVVGHPEVEERRAE